MTAPVSIADRILEYSPNVDLGLLQRAYVFSAKVHEGQERLSGEPYLIHPLEVAGLVADMRMDSKSIIAAILHDVIEDTPTLKEQVASQFGDEVARIVAGCSDTDQTPKPPWRHLGRRSQRPPETARIHGACPRRSGCPCR